MKTYKVFDPYNGLYSDASTLEDLKKILAEKAWEAFLKITNNNPYTIVEVDEQGNETWKTMKGEPMISPEEIKNMIEKSLHSRR
jgi:hypothetical protein